jgi:hypothetical protein
VDEFLKMKNNQWNENGSQSNKMFILAMRLIQLVCDSIDTITKWQPSHNAIQRDRCILRGPPFSFDFLGGHSKIEYFMFAVDLLSLLVIEVGLFFDGCSDNGMHKLQ